jgi:hypothetical protein
MPLYHCDLAGEHQDELFYAGGRLPARMNADRTSRHHWAAASPGGPKAEVRVLAIHNERGIETTELIP